MYEVARNPARPYRNSRGAGLPSFALSRLAGFPLLAGLRPRLYYFAALRLGCGVAGEIRCETLRIKAFLRGDKAYSNRGYFTVTLTVVPCETVPLAPFTVTE